HMTILFLFSYPLCHHRHLHSFPARRSSDLFLSQNQVLAAEGPRPRGPSCLGKESLLLRWKHCGCVPLGTCTLRTQYCHQGGTERDRKSTRLNSSHVKISYAVFCLKKKNNKS